MQQPVATSSQNSAPIVEAMPLPVRKQRIELELRLFKNKAETAASEFPVPYSGCFSSLSVLALQVPALETVWEENEAEVDATGGARQAVSRESLLAAEASQGLCASDNILDEMFSQPCLAGVYLEEEDRLAFNQLL